jgi:hypothetical protein
MEIMKDSPSNQQLNQFAAQAVLAAKSCGDLYGQQLRVTPNSLTALRRYYRYQLEVCNNVMLAEEIGQKADELEAAMSSDQRNIHGNVRFMQTVCFPS